MTKPVTGFKFSDACLLCAEEETERGKQEQKVAAEPLLSPQSCAFRLDWLKTALSNHLARITGADRNDTGLLGCLC